MIQYYLYELNNTCPLDDWKNALATMQDDILDIIVEDEYHGCILVEEAFDASVQQFLQSLTQDFDDSIRLMRSYGNTVFSRYLIQNSITFHGLFQDNDAFLFSLINQDDTTLPYLRRELQELTRDDYETIHAYIACDLNAMKTSDYMYLHRNTCNYRLQKIYDKTGFDLKNHHHAILLQQFLLVTGK